MTPQNTHLCMYFNNHHAFSYRHLSNLAKQVGYIMGSEIELINCFGD